MSPSTSTPIAKDHDSSSSSILISVIHTIDDTTRGVLCDSRKHTDHPHRQVPDVKLIYRNEVSGIQCKCVVIAYKRSPGNFDDGSSILDNSFMTQGSDLV